MDIKKEQLIILGLVADGKLSIDEALELLHVLEESAAYYESADENALESPAAEMPVGVHFMDNALVFRFPNIEFYGDLDWARGKIDIGLESVKADKNQQLVGAQFQLN
jgi:hypothetical protein